MDDQFLIVSQNRQYKSTGSAKLNHKNIHFDIFDKSGNYIKSNILFGNAKEYGTQHISKSFFWDDQSLVVLGNVDVEHLDKLDAPIDESKNYPSKNNCIVASIFKTDNTLNHIQLSEPDNISIDGGGIRFIEGNFYFLGHNKKHSKMRLGQLDIK